MLIKNINKLHFSVFSILHYLKVLSEYFYSNFIFWLNIVYFSVLKNIN